MSTDELLEKAKSLPATQQLQLVEDLLDVLDRPDTDIDAAWATEARDRLVAYRSGKVKAIPLEDVLAKYRVTGSSHPADSD